MSYGRGGVESERRGPNVEQHLWTGHAGPGAAVPGSGRNLRHQAPSHYAALLERPSTGDKPGSQLAHRPSGIVEAHQYAANMWSNGPLVTPTMPAMKNEDCESWPQHMENSIRPGTGSNPEIDQALSSNKSSPSIPSRPHAAVEKRYRRTVNTKLQQLHAAIPPSGSFSIDSSERLRSSIDGGEPEQAAKPVVLDKAIQYTTHLIETYRKYDSEIDALRQQVRDWLGEEEATSTSSAASDKGSAG